MGNENRITPKAILKLRRIGNKYMLVESMDNGINLTNVYSMNETAAWLWEAICGEDSYTPEELAENLCKEYRVEYECALRDVKHQLDDWRRMGLVK